MFISFHTIVFTHDENNWSFAVFPIYVLDEETFARRRRVFLHKLNIWGLHIL